MKVNLGNVRFLKTTWTPIPLHHESSQTHVSQEHFEAYVKAALAEIPARVAGDPASEDQRAAKVANVRKLIANRWNDLQNLWMHWSRDELETFIDNLKAFLGELTVVYGEEVPFAPMPTDPFLDDLMKDMDKMNGLDGDGGEPGSSRSSMSCKSSTSGSSSASMLPHEFRFLVNAKSVWTVMKVSWIIVARFC